MHDMLTVESLQKLNKMRELKRERERLEQAVLDKTASKEDKELLNKSKSLEKDLQVAETKDQQLQAQRDSLRDKLEQAKLRLRELSLKKLGVTHVFRVIIKKKSNKDVKHKLRKARPFTANRVAHPSSTKRKWKTRESWVKNT